MYCDRIWKKKIIKISIEQSKKGKDSIVFFGQPFFPFSIHHQNTNEPKNKTKTVKKKKTVTFRN